MTTLTAAASSRAPSMGTRAGFAVSDALAMAKRNILRIARAPDQVVFTLISPIMFTLLFRYVFGGAVGNGLGAATSYATYLIPHRGPDSAVQCGHHRLCPGRRPAEGLRRPAPQPADVA